MKILQCLSCRARAYCKGRFNLFIYIFSDVYSSSSSRFETNSNFCCVSYLILFLSLCIKHYCVIFVRHVVCPSSNLHQALVSVDHFQFHRFALNFTFTFLRRFGINKRTLSHWECSDLRLFIMANNAGLRTSCECLSVVYWLFRLKKKKILLFS